MLRRILAVAALALSGLTPFGCAPLAPAELTSLLGDAFADPEVFESVTLIGAADGQIYLSRNDLPDDLMNELLAVTTSAAEPDAAAADVLRFDVGSVNLRDGKFVLVADDFVTSPVATANSRWLIWENAANGGLVRLDRASGEQAEFLVGDGDSAYHQILLLDGDTLWLMRHDYAADALAVQPPSALIAIDLQSGGVTSFGDALDDSAFQIALREDVIYAFEVESHEPFLSDSADGSDPYVSIDFTPPAYEYRLVAFDTSTRTRSVIIESLGVGVNPADPQFDAAGRLLWREDNYDTLTTTIRAMTIADHQLLPLAEFAGETPTLPDFDNNATGDISFQPTGRSSAVLAWNERGLLIEEIEYTDSTGLFPSTTHRYIFRGFDGAEFDVLSFETSGLFRSPITTIIDDTIVCRDVNDGELILTNIDTRESKRIAIFSE